MNEPIFDENAVFLTKELETYRKHMIQSRLQDREELQELGDTDFREFDAITEEYGMMSPETLFDKLINNFWCRLPGGFYRDMFKNKMKDGVAINETTQRNSRSIDDLDVIIEREGLYDIAQRITAKDPQLNTEEKRTVLQILYCEMRKLGYSRKELTS